MGAINKITNEYEYPRIADKNNKYICPDCKKDVILRKGNIRVHHFSHYASENPCMYYERPGESQIHKDAKMALKTILQRGNDIHLLRTCIGCKAYHRHIIEKHNKDTIIHLEYSFIFNNSRKNADVAYIDGESIKYIFEICYKNKTREENRPEPWFEINAEQLLCNINNLELSDNLIELPCIRYNKCNQCITRENEEKEQIRLRIEKYNEEQRLRIEKYNEEQRVRIEREREKQRIKEEEDKRYKQLVEIRKEIKNKIWAEHKRCSKCKSYERCKKCVDKLCKKYNDEINEKLKTYNK
jgi:hypothetical protein